MVAEPKLKIWYESDELYPFYSFEDKESTFNRDNSVIEVDLDLWEQYKKAAEAYWPLRRKLVELVDTDGY